MQWHRRCAALHTRVRHLPLMEQAEACIQESGSPCNLALSLRLCRLLVRLENNRSRALQAADDATLRKYESEEGPAALQSLQARLPVLKRHQLVRVPEQAFPLFELMPTKAQEEAVRLCSWTCSSQSSNHGPALDQLWGDIHKTVEVGLTMQDVEGEVSLKPSRCQEAGVCVCTGPGVQLAALRQALFRSLKKHFATKDDKELLVQGFIAFRLFTQTEQEGTLEIWHHISLMSLNPYFPVLQAMTPTVAEEQSFFPDFQYLEVLGT